MAEPAAPDWLDAVLAAGATTVVGVLAWLGVRFQARESAKAHKSDPQAALNEGWDDLLNQMRLELKAASHERNEYKRVLTEERAAWAVERQAWAEERTAMIGRINQLQAVGEGFERLLRRNGIAMPERRIYKPESDPVHGTLEIIETTLRQDGFDE